MVSHSVAVRRSNTNAINEASRKRGSIGGSRIFFRGGLKDEFIRMCTDRIVVKAQLLRQLFLTNTVNNHTHFGQSAFSPLLRLTKTFLEQKRPSKQFSNLPNLKKVTC